MTAAALSAPASCWVPIADGHYLGLAPSRRFPLYTRGNAGEVFPEVQYPLSFTVNWSVSTSAFEGAATSAGILVRADIENDPTALTGVFGGYTYLNVSSQRLIAARFPGTDVASVDQQYLGASTAPPYVRDRRDRRLRSSIAAVRFALRTLRTKGLPQLDIDRRSVERWRDAVPSFDSAPDQELVDFVRSSMPLGAELFERHLIVSGQASVPTGLLVQLCDKLGRPELAARLMGGIGDVASAVPAGALWELGRVVAAHDGLTAQFDAGLDGLHGRLLADPAAAPFLRAFDEFVVRFGSRGPNEWETACDTWGTDPSLALALVDRMRGAAEDHAPTLRGQGLAVDRSAALESVLARAKRRRLAKTAASVALFNQSRERTKTTVVEYLHGIRLVMKELDRRVNERSGGSKNDLWFVTIDEVDDYVENPVSYRAVITERRRMRDLLSSREPPFIIDGTVGVPDFSTWRRRDEATTVGVWVGQKLTGIAGCPGVAQGRARVVLDPSDPTALEAGDVLIAPLTDPAWTPLFVPAAAVIVDVGAMLSHAVIVSRELGIPSVVSVTGATRMIPNGALVEVDGSAGTVKIIELP